MAWAIAWPGPVIDSLRTKLWLAVGLLAIVAVAVIAFTARQSARLEFERFQSFERSRDDVASASIVDRIAASLDGKCCDSSVVASVVTGLADDRVVLVFNEAGELVASGGTKAQAGHITATFRDGLLNLEAQSVDPSKETGFAVVIRGSPSRAIRLADGKPASVHVVLWPGGAPRQTRETFQGSVDRRLLAATTLVAVLALFITWGVSRRLTAPITELRDAAQALAGGDLTRRVSSQGSDELTDLARAFNAMATGLERQETLRRHLVHDVAHELRTPLTALRCRVETLLDGLAKDPASALREINGEISHLSRLVSDLEDLARAEGRDLNLAVVELDVGAVCQSAIRTAALEDDPRLRVRLAVGIIAMGDVVRVRQILVNLLTNADRFTPPGGIISVSSERRDDRAVIRVHNSGSSLGSEEIRQVFDRFYRADPARQRATGGSGLGLAIARQLAEAQGGRIAASSDETGVAFELSLPTPAL